MFDFVHEKKRLVQIVLGLIILPFAFWGVDSYRRSGDVAAVASVNGTKISQQEFDNSLRQQQDRLRQMMGDNFDARMFDKPEMKRAVLDNLVAQKLLIDQAKSVGLQVTDEQVAQVIGQIEAFQDGGKFDKTRYQSVLANQNMSPAMFEAKVRDELATQQLHDGFALNGYSSNAITQKIIGLNEQQRTISQAIIDFPSFLSVAHVDDAGIKKFYDDNQKEFQIPEQAKVEFVHFAQADLAAKIAVSEDDLHKYYDERTSEFGEAEQRQASHILISVPANAPQSEQDAAKLKAEQLLQEIKKNPSDFANLAKQNSQDPGSAAKGGDLGFFAKGMMVKPFEDAVFSLKVDELSGVVKSDFGYHIIKLTNIKPSHAKSYAEVRETIASKLRQQQAADKFAELADKFSNTVYEQSDSLKPAAELVGAVVQQGGWLKKGEALNEPWTAKAVEAVFSEDAVKNKRNTPAIEVGQNSLLSARIIEYKAASTRPLAEVQAEIRQKLMRSQAMAAAIQQGKEVLAKLQKGESVALNWSASQSITRAQRGALDLALVRQIFQANPAKLPQYVGLDNPQNGYQIVRIETVKEAPAASDEKLKGYAQQLRKMLGDEMFQAYLADAKKQATIKITQPEAEAVKP